MDLSGFMQGHYPPEPASGEARLSPDGSVIPNSLGEKQGFSWLWQGAGFCCLEKVLMLIWRLFVATGGFKPGLGTWGWGVTGPAETFGRSKTYPSYPS